MTLYEIIHTLKAIALSQPNIRSASDGSVYEAMDAKNSVTYDVFHITQTTHSEDLETDYYGLTLFYISRLEDSLEDNRLQAQSIGKSILSNIIRSFCENWSIDFPTITYVPFTQKFADLTAGVYCNIRLEIPKGIWCADDYISEVVPGKNIKLQDLGITITQNGLTVVTPDAEYDGIGEIRIVTDVPQSSAVLQYKEVEYTDNGEYTVRPDVGYDGLSEVAISISVPSSGGDYDEGYADGVADQKAKLSSTSFTQNSTYTRADGWSSVTINVDDRYEEGVADQKAKLSTLSVSANGEYTRADGYSAITVDVPQQSGGTYEEGYADGEAAQKAKLSITSVTENGTYTREDGYSAFTVDVPSDVNNQFLFKLFDRTNTTISQRTSAGQTKWYISSETYRPELPSGYSGFYPVQVNVSADITDFYDSAYAAGFAAGASACSGYFISALTLVVDSAITNYGVATSTYSPESAITDIHYTSSDPSIATIDPDTGEITVISDGVSTICAIDDITHIQDCKQVLFNRTNYNSSYLTFAFFDNGGLYWMTSSESFLRTIEYSKDNGVTWTSITSSTGIGGTFISVSEGDIVQFKGDNAAYANSSNTNQYCYFRTNTSSYVYGNIMSLIDSTGFTTATTLSSAYTFRHLFRFCSLIESAKNLVLPATGLTEGCYSYMFQGCTSLAQAPSLPATTLAEKCYYYMFYGCASLTTAPDLPATTLASYCYDGMFSDCTSLAQAPSLPATTLADYCYSNMFYSCTTLTTAPVLPALRLVNYCYYQMFIGCRKLNYIKCLANSFAPNCTTRWVEYVQTTSGTFVKDANTSWERGDGGIPNNWTIIDNS